MVSTQQMLVGEVHNLLLVVNLGSEESTTSHLLTLAVHESPLPMAMSVCMFVNVVIKESSNRWTD